MEVLIVSPSLEITLIDNFDINCLNWQMCIKDITFLAPKKINPCTYSISCDLAIQQENGSNSFNFESKEKVTKQTYSLTRPILKFFSHSIKKGLKQSSVDCWVNVTRLTKTFRLHIIRYNFNKDKDLLTEEELFDKDLPPFLIRIAFRKV